MKLNIIHLIGSLNNGGAENQLATIARAQASQGENVSILLFDMHETNLEKLCLANNIKLINLGIKKGSIIKGFLNLNLTLKKLNNKNTIIQSWMYTSDLFVSLCYLLNIFAKNKYKIFWNVRSTIFTGHKKFSIKRFLISSACIPFSYFAPIKIFNCANSAKKSHIRVGYCRLKMEVIHNAIDSEKFISKKLNEAINKRFTIGFAGRNDEIKNFNEFLLLIDDLLKLNKNINVLVAGRGYNVNKMNIKKFSSSIDKIEFLGEQNDMSAFYNKLDLLVCVSHSEGFPNIIAEAAICGTDCISYDVGDVSEILPVENIIANRSYSNLLKEVIRKINIWPFYDQKIITIKNNIQDKFQVDKIVKKYRSFYLNSLN